MKVLKLLWNATPAVIIGKKIHKSVKQTQEQKANQPKQPKPEKPLTLYGIYYSSHPAIHGQRQLSLEFSSTGVDVNNGLRKKKRIDLMHFDWDEIISFEAITEDKSQMQTNQRVTATRMAAVGVFALAAPKKEQSGKVHSKFYNVLHTITGDIELEYEWNTGNTGSGSMGDMNRNLTQMMINKRNAATGEIRRMVAENATGVTS